MVEYENRILGGFTRDSLKNSDVFTLLQLFVSETSEPTLSIEHIYAVESSHVDWWLGLVRPRLARLIARSLCASITVSSFFSIKLTDW